MTNSLPLNPMPRGETARRIPPAPAWDRSRRALVAAGLAGLFLSPPGVDAVASLRRGEGAAWLGGLAGEADIGAGISQMIAALEEPLDDAALAARLGMAFGVLFVGIGGPDTVAPYESAYCGSGRLFQAPVSEMEALLAKCSLSVGRDCPEPADHIGIELFLLSHLLFAGNPAASAVRKRLRRWVPAFCAACVARDATGFWAGAASAVAALVATSGRETDLERTIEPEDRNLQ